MKIRSIRHEWPEKAGFVMERKQGHAEYTFLHFFNSVHIQVQGKMVRTRPHACILVAPGTPQWFVSTTPLVHDWFHFTAAVPPSDMACDTVYYPADPTGVTAIVREMETELSLQKNAYEQLISLKMQELFIKIGRSAAGQKTAVANSTVTKRLQQLRREMVLHLDERWTTERMANAVHLSPSRFYAVYRSTFGQSPTEDLIGARIEAAKTALAFSDEPLELLAARLGYANITHFHRQFQSRVGNSPLAYRNEKR